VDIFWWIALINSTGFKKSGEPQPRVYVPQSQALKDAEQNSAQMSAPDGA
jgi:hypothetical protein